MNRNLRKRKTAGVSPTRGSKAESPTTITTEQPTKKAKVDEDEHEIEEKPLVKVETETEEKSEEKKAKDEELVGDEAGEKKSIGKTNAESEEKTKKETEKEGEEEVEVLTTAPKVTETITIDEKTEVEEEAVKVVDPYAFLSDSDRKLMQTDIVEFLKRFTPRYFVPVYRTWSIPKSVAKQT